MTLTLGSLFDGSGGFPFAASLEGIEPRWASEIEPYPIAVTRSHFPAMVHLGDVSSIDGAQIEPVDVVTFGSPCQDLSVAGVQRGLAGSRSSLFFQAVRIIKEMKGASHGKFPRYAIWENVLGSFTSNNGDDFGCVLNGLLEIVEVAPVVRFKDTWRHAGAILGDDYSLAWRVLDAQFWGVPQRRKRVFVVLDLQGQSAPEVLFEPKIRRIYQEKAFKKSENNPENCSKSFERRNFWTVSHGSFFKWLDFNIFGTLTKTIGSGPPVVFTEQNARTLSPSECAILQGFPPDWGKIGAISDDEFPFWSDVWDEYCRVFGKRRKSEKQIRKWMKSPYREYQEYEMWGNGVALPCVRFILANIARILRAENDCALVSD